MHRALVAIRSEAGLLAVRARLPALMRKLDDPSPSERAKAAFLIGTTKQETRRAVVALRTLLDDSDPSVRPEAKNALADISAAPAAAVIEPGHD